MPHDIDPKTVIEMTIECLFYEQRLLNVLHFVTPDDFPPTDSVEVLDAMNEETGSGPTSTFSIMCDAMSDTGKITKLVLQEIHPTRYARRLYLYDNPGTIVGSALTANTAAVLTKYTELATDHTNAPKMGQIGSFHLGGIPTTKYLNGLLDDTYVSDKLVPLCTDLASAFTEGAAATIKPVLFHRTSTPKSWDPITGLVPQRQLRVMRRRTVGLGI